MVNVLVTGAGGGVGQSIIKALGDTDYSVIAADGELLGTGLYAATKGFVIPYASNTYFIPRLIEICKQTDTKYIFPGLDAELAPLAASVDQFKDNGITVVVSAPHVINTADDKRATAQFLEDHGFAAPQTYPLAERVDEHLGYPFIVKPQKGGARSKNVYKVADRRMFERLLNELDPQAYVAQEFIEGDEYTCGSVNLGEACWGTIVMRRTLRNGDTYKAFVVKDPGLEAYIKDVATRLKPFGACNFQFRLRDDVPHIFEINARCSGTTASRTLAGFNEPKMILDYLVHRREPTYSISEISILRYWKELVVANDRIDMLQSEGTVDGDGSTL